MLVLKSSSRILKNNSTISSLTFLYVARSFQTTPSVNRGQINFSRRKGGRSKNHLKNDRQNQNLYQAQPRLNHKLVKLISDRKEDDIQSSKAFQSIDKRIQRNESVSEYLDIIYRELSLAELENNSSDKNFQSFITRYLDNLETVLTAIMKHNNKLSYNTVMKFIDYMKPNLQLIKVDQNAALQNFQMAYEKLFTPNMKDIPLILYFVYKNPYYQFPEYLSEKYELHDSTDENILNKKFQYFINLAFNYCEHLAKSDIKNLSNAKIDFRNPAKWFPLALELKRHIIMHVGPTNSGKTYNALQKLKASELGYFAGPLRLLAREVYERFKEEGIRCNLVTGEEIIEDIHPRTGMKATLSSGTVEMISFSTKYDVVVLDEIQMISDPQRGWAWTQALLGVRLKEIHLCGEERSVPLIEKICKLTGDKLTINKYERLGALKVEEAPLGRDFYESLKKGDCLVAFSKNKILNFKQNIELKTDLKVSVIYGALPAETRVLQAKLFNSGKSDILVASDAVGMGLNLAIRRVIFSDSKKYDGIGTRALSVSEVKQIAGRAGRYKTASFGSETKQESQLNESLETVGDDLSDIKADELIVEKKTKASTGYVTCFNTPGLKHIRACLSTNDEPLTEACLWPPNHIWSEYISAFPVNAKLKDILQVYQKEVTNNNIFFSSSVQPRVEICDVFEQKNVGDSLLLGDKLTLLTVPLSRFKFPLISSVFQEYTRTIKDCRTRCIFDFTMPFHLLLDVNEEASYNGQIYLGSSAFLDEFDSNPENSDIDLSRLEKLECLHILIMVFCWLSYRYPRYFVERETATHLRHLCEKKISEALNLKSLTKKKKSLDFENSPSLILEGNHKIN